MKKTILSSSTGLLLLALFLLLSLLISGSTVDTSSHVGEKGDLFKMPDPDTEPPSCPCPREEENYEPVCGTDGNTYANSCLLKCAGVKCECFEECPCLFYYPCPPGTTRLT